MITTIETYPVIDKISFDRINNDLIIHYQDIIGIVDSFDRYAIVSSKYLFDPLAHIDELMNGISAQDKKDAIKLIIEKAYPSKSPTPAIVIRRSIIKLCKRQYKSLVDIQNLEHENMLRIPQNKHKLSKIQLISLTD